MRTRSICSAHWHQLFGALLGSAGFWAQGDFYHQAPRWPWLSILVSWACRFRKLTPGAAKLHKEQHAPKQHDRSSRTGGGGGRQTPRVGSSHDVLFCRLREVLLCYTSCPEHQNSEVILVSVSVSNPANGASAGLLVGRGAWRCE